MTSEHGKIDIAHGVIAVIAEKATLETSGVVEVSATLGDRFKKALNNVGIKAGQGSSGIEVEKGESEVAIDINIHVEFGVRIHEVAAQIQRNVVDSVESMTDMRVVEVNIKVIGIKLPVAEKVSAPAVQTQERLALG